jgi:hypothetical protein
MSTRFVHTLLFACPECDLPLAITRLTDERNLERVDGQMRQVQCTFCGNNFTASSVNARKHYVEEWSGVKFGKNMA